jgi:beta-glucosidase
MTPYSSFISSRRDFLALTAGAGAAWALGGVARADGAPAASGSASAPAFPADFAWGAATAAFQVEGAAREDGKGPSIWDHLTHLTGKVDNGDNADVACDFYHRYADDIKMMVDLGLRHFRFSISWPRVLPAGVGAVNAKGLDFYSRLVDALLAAGITPHATLFHWDLPQALHEKYGGWQSRQIVADFGTYAALLGKTLGDRVQHWMTLNEIGSFTGGYAVDKPPESAPSVVLKTKQEKNQLTHYALLAHGTACLALRASCAKGPNVALAENYGPFVPIIETPAHIEAAQRAFRRLNGGKLIPILTGQYDPGWLEDNHDALPRMEANDLATIHQPLDALGCNCYTGRYVKASDTATGYDIIPWFPAYPVANIKWLHFVPESIYWSVRLVGDALGLKTLPIFISENGCPDGATPDANGFVLDIDRIMYYRAYLSQVQRAIAEGYPVTGFFPWSLMDNFEWNRGFSKRFGLVHIDYATQKRTPKLSYGWYQEVIRQHRVA